VFFGGELCYWMSGKVYSLQFSFKREESFLLVRIIGSY
jgi:hypothetical protein